MVGSMIGLGPHEMTTWLWVLDFGIVMFFLVMTVIAWFAASKLIDSERRRASLR